MDLDFPNVLRIIKGDSAIPSDKVVLLETNMDNVSGEILGNLFNRLMAEGALDVTLIPVLMKKPSWPSLEGYCTSTRLRHHLRSNHKGNWHIRC